MKFALSIAGFDGSAGAGIIADTITMAHFGVYAQTVCTAHTVQNENEFLSVNWVSYENIKSQLEILFKCHNFDFIKIGLIENSNVLNQIVDFLKYKNPKAFILWDPIVSATAGFNFINDKEINSFIQIMKKLDLITPNQDEFTFLDLGLLASRNEIELGKDFAILLKGGHLNGINSVDTLWLRDGSFHSISSPRILNTNKHGTGCHLSSAIIANLVLGYSLLDSCKIAKKYMDNFIKSGEGRLGFIF